MPHLYRIAVLSDIGNLLDCNLSDVCQRVQDQGQYIGDAVTALIHGRTQDSCVTVLCEPSGTKILQNLPMNEYRKMLDNLPTVIHEYLQLPGPHALVSDVHEAYPARNCFFAEGFEPTWSKVALEDTRRQILIKTR
jgi:hypothetical protein